MIEIINLGMIVRNPELKGVNIHDFPDETQKVKGEVIMIDINKQYRTRDGREVKLLMTDAGSNRPVIGAFQHEDGTWVPCAWLSNGQYAPFDNYCSNFDLVEVKTKHVRWLNCYEDAQAATREEADRLVSKFARRIACIRVEFEEGEGLS
jgi:hypothetical protein